MVAHKQASDVGFWRYWTNNGIAANATYMMSQ